MSLVQWKRRAEAVHFEDEVFEKLDLRSMKAFGSTWKGCIFRFCRFDLADWRASKFENCIFYKCEAPLTNFATSFFEDCEFEDCNMEQASFMGSHFHGGGFEGCRMAYSETLFQDATVKRSLRFNGCNLHGSNLDFRQVEPGGMVFEGCNLWGIKIGMSCEFWNSTIDERSVKQFLALVARVADDPRIAELAGDQYAVVNRAIDRGAKSTPASMTSRETGSNPSPSCQEAMDLTATATTTPSLPRMMTSS